MMDKDELGWEPWEVNPERIKDYKYLIEDTARKVYALVKRNGVYAKTVDFSLQPRTHNDGSVCKDFFAFVCINFYERISAAEYGFLAEEIGVLFRYIFDDVDLPAWGRARGQVSEVYFYKTPSRRRIKVRFLLKMSYG